MPCIVYRKLRQVNHEDCALTSATALGTDCSMLSELEVGSYHAFGFTVLRGCLSAEEMAALNEAYARLIETAPRYDYFGSAGTLCLLHFVDHDPAMAALVGHPRLVEAMRDIWGRPCLYFGSDMWSNCDDTPWHSDGQPGRQCLSIKVTVYLDTMTADQGSLNLIPGSHHPQFCADIMQRCGVWDRGRPRLRLERDSIPGAISVHSVPGDVVIWDNRMWHSAWKRCDGRPRRALFMSYIPDPDDDLIAVNDVQQLVDGLTTGERNYLFSQKLLQWGGTGVQEMAARLELLTGGPIREASSAAT